MTDSAASYTFDVRGLLALSNSSGNQFAAAMADIDSGAVRIFSCAFNEFSKVYDDEAVVFSSLLMRSTVRRSLLLRKVRKRHFH
jgi:hypothetical protein